MHKEKALRRHAIGIINRLPEDPNQARWVLDLARELLDGFVDPSTAPPVRPSLYLVPPVTDTPSALAASPSFSRTGKLKDDASPR